MKNMTLFIASGAVIGLSLVAGAWSRIQEPPQEPPRAFLAHDLSETKMVSEQDDRLGKLQGSVFFRCKECGGDHLSPIGFDDKPSFETARLFQNHLHCPKTGRSNTYDGKDMYWKDA